MNTNDETLAARLARAGGGNIGEPMPHLFFTATSRTRLMVLTAKATSVNGAEDYHWIKAGKQPPETLLMVVRALRPDAGWGYVAGFGVN